LIFTLHGILHANKSFNLVHNLALSVPSVESLERMDMNTITSHCSVLKHLTVGIRGKHWKSFEVDDAKRSKEKDMEGPSFNWSAPDEFT